MLFDAECFKYTIQMRYILFEYIHHRFPIQFNKFRRWTLMQYLAIYFKKKKKSPHLYNHKLCVEEIIMKLLKQIELR